MSRESYFEPDISSKSEGKMYKAGSEFLGFSLLGYSFLPGKIVWQRMKTGPN